MDINRRDFIGCAGAGVLAQSLPAAAKPQGRNPRPYSGLDWSKAHHWLIWHGRRVCHSRKPDCENCTLRSWCRLYGGDPSADRKA